MFSTREGVELHVIRYKADPVIEVKQVAET